MDINEVLLKAQEVSSEFLSSYCVVNGAILPLDEIERMGYREFWQRSKINMPLKLYKYFPNTTKDDNGTPVNYSQIALINNTVFMQSPSEFDDVYDSDIHIEYSEYERLRLKEYCSRCQISVDEHATVQEIGNNFIRRLYDVFSETGSFDGVFIRPPKSEIEKLSNESFSLRLQNRLLKGEEFGQAVAEIIQDDYNNYSSQLKQTFRISCFATTPYSQLMWGGSYANCHRGFCLEYTVLPNEEQFKDVFQNLFPMVYCKVRPNMTERLTACEDQPITEEKLWNIYLHGALRKSIDWAYQNEWRLLLPMRKEEDTSHYNIQFYPITKVFLGNRMSSGDRKAIIDICNQRNIQYTGVTRNSDLFEMRDCEILCEECPSFKNGLQ